MRKNNSAPWKWGLIALFLGFGGWVFSSASASPTSKPAVKKDAKPKAVAKTSKKAKPAVAKIVGPKKSTTTKPKPQKKPMKALTEREIRWQIDAWEIHERAASVYHALLEWKKYTRDPKLSTKKAYQALTKIRKQKGIYNVIKVARERKLKDPVLRRRVEMLWDRLKAYHLSKKVDALRAKIHVLTDKLNGIQASFRGSLNGKKMSNRDLGLIIRRNADRTKREAAWRAYSAVGPKVLQGGFMKLVQLRNQYAKMLGHKSFFHYRYHKLHLDPVKMWKMYETLRKATKKSMEAVLKSQEKTLKIKQIMPWDRRYASHLQAKKVMDMDKFFSSKKLLPILFKAYKEMGFTLKKMDIKMDLYPRPKKNQHAYCFDIDPPHDVRILANVGRPGQRPYETLFHEMGHAVHGKMVTESVRTFRSLPDEGFLNEGSANFFGNLVDTRSFYARYLNIPAPTLAQIVEFKRRRLHNRLASIRWTLIWMYFERDLYVNIPNVKDPSAQFWKRYKQFMGPVPKNPPPYWGILIHFVSHPIYYQNYLLADLLAAQLHETVKQKTGKNHILGNAKVAAYLAKAFFGYGRRYQWDVLLKKMTGKPLSAKAYLKSLRTAWR